MTQFSTPADLPVVVVGAGPVGLAAAAHLHERGLPFLVLEAGEHTGASVAAWGHVRLFSPWRYDIDAVARRLLEATDWVSPDPDQLPTGAELVRQYLRPLAALPAIAPHVRYGARVAAISRQGVDRLRTAGREAEPLVIRLADGTEVLARAVIDASGTWLTPSPVGANGLPARGETAVRHLIDTALPDVLGADRIRFAGRHTVVVGAGHSAANTLMALAELATQEPGTRITWAVRSRNPPRAFGGGDADALPARGALGAGLRLLVDTGAVTLATGFAVTTLRPAAAEVELVAADGRTIRADRIVGATGFRPDHSVASELRLDLDPILGATRALAPLIDPNEHSCGTVRPHGVDELTHPEPNYFAVGMKSYGRAPTFLMATGYEQVRSITAALAGDWHGARLVELDLPATGVCSTTLGAKALLAEAADRLDISPEVPARLIASAMHHLPTAGSTAGAVRLAAAELQLDEATATQLAVLAAEQFDEPAAPPKTGPGSLIPVQATRGACCG